MKLQSVRHRPRPCLAARALPAIAWLMLIPAGTATAAQRNELYIINQKPASVSVLDATDWKIIHTIPLDPEPTAAVVESQGRFLFVLHRGFFTPDGGFREAQGELVVYDLESRSRLKGIPLGWKTKDLGFSLDGRYLLCVSDGKTGTKKKSEEYGSTTVVDTRTAEVTATLPAGRLGLRVALTNDASRIFVLSLGEVAKKTKNAPSVLTVFARDNPAPLATVPLGRASRLALSLDERWLYVLDPGWPSKKPAEHRNGEVHVFDTATLASAGSYDVGTQPRTLEVSADDSLTVLAQVSFKEDRGKLYRMRGNEKPEVVDVGAAPQYMRRHNNRSGMLVVSNEDVRFLPDAGAATASTLVLNPRKGAKSAGPNVQTLGGLPGELLFLPDQNRVALSVKNAAGASSKVAILDLKDNKIQQIVTTGRGSVKFGKFLGAMAASVAMSALSYGAGYAGAQASGSPFFFYNVYTFAPKAPNVVLAGSTDGQFVYALNTQTNDVTVIRLADGEVLDMIPVGGGCRRLALAPGGKFVYAYTPGEISLIDTQSNKKTLSLHAVGGKVHQVYALEADRTLVALTSQRLLLWNMETGQLARTVEGFAEPFLLLDPRPR